MANLVDLQYTKADKKQQKSEMDMPQKAYSYGLCIRLEKPELEKLGIDMPEVGDEWHIMAVGRVTQVYKEAREYDQDSQAVSVQLMFMQVSSEGQEPEEEDTAEEESKESGDLMKVKGTVASYYKKKS